MNQTPEQSSNTAIDANWLNWLPGIAGFLAFTLISSYIFTFQKLPLNENPAAWGGFGDYMGGLLNPLISLFTLIVAMKVWNLQKTELLETRKAVEEQGNTAEQQRREQRFFDFLQIYRSTVDSIEFEYSNDVTTVTLKGKHALKHLTSKNPKNPIIWLSQFFIVPKEKHWTTHSFSREEAERRWDHESPIFDHYFRTVFTLLREAEFILKGEHWRYIELFRAQLSRDEVNLLAMNILFNEEGKKMRPQFAYYGILKHMPHNQLREIAMTELDPKTFGLGWIESQTARTPREEVPC